MKYITDRKRAAANGSAHHGTSHFIEQRMSAVVLVVLIICFMCTTAPLIGEDIQTVKAAFQNFWVGLITGATIFVVGIHLIQGLQVVIEDYIAPKFARALLLTAMKYGIYLMIFASLFAIVLLSV